MKLILNRWVKYTALFALGIAVAIPLAAQALVSYPAGSLLQPGDVSTTTIRDYSVSPSKISTGSSFTMFGLTTTNSTSTNATTTNLAVTSGGTRLNGVPYNWPNLQGGAGTVATNDGSGNIAWTATTNTSLSTTFTAGGTITQGTPVVLQQGGAVLLKDTSAFTTGTAATSLTFGYGIGSKANEILFVNVGFAAAVSSLTCSYNSVAMTQVDSVVGSGNNSNDYVFRLYAPTVGSNNVTCSWTTSSTWALSALSYSGAAQTNNPEATSSQAGLSSSLTTLTDKDWLLMFATSNCGGVFSNGTNVNWYQSGTQNFDMADSGAYVTPAGSKSQSATQCGSPASMSLAIAPLDPTQAADTGSYIYPATSSAGGNASSTVGIATTAASTGQSVSVALNGLISNIPVSFGIATGTKYYVGTSGTYSSTPSGCCGIEIGIGASYNSLIMRNGW